MKRQILLLDKLSREAIEENNCVSIGKLSDEMIDFIRKCSPEVGEILSPENDILFWKDRISHTENHKNDFISDILFENCFEDIPSFIKRPDYISIDKKKRSISFIRQFSQNISVAIRINTDGKMCYRTMYPLMSSQLDDYMKNNTAWKYVPLDK